MTAPPDDTTTDLHAVIAALRTERDAALSEKAALAEALAQRHSEFDKRIAHQTAANEVLKAISASPRDPQSVFDLIARQAAKLCNVPTAAVAMSEFDGEYLHLRAWGGWGAETSEDYLRQFPMRPDPGTAVGRAILNRRVIHIRDVDQDSGIAQAVRTMGVRSTVAIPLLRGEQAIGVIAVASPTTGGFADPQVELLGVFAEQAVIAISSAETYRALQSRTGDLQEALEYQTAIRDVLKVISRSTFDLQPVLDTVVEAATRLCDADQAMIWRREGDLVRLVANYGFPPEYEAVARELGAMPLDNFPRNVGPRAIREGRVVHVHDVAAELGYAEVAIRLGRQRTSLGVPLLRAGETVGSIVLARQRVEPFTDRQMELVSTFADQAVIAIENTRLLTEQREALEQQTATAEVLQVINANPGDLTPVFDAMLEKAMRLCEAAFGSLYTYDGERFHSAAQHGVPPAYAEFRAKNPPAELGGGRSAIGRLISHKRPVHILDIMDEELYRSGGAEVRSIVDLGGARTLLNVPLLKDDVLQGYISIYRQEVRAFSDKQITVLENFAAQAVIAMENARLITEQREALEQQTATAEVLQVINASPGNLAPVFDAMLEKAMRLCEARLGAFFRYDGTFMHLAASRGAPPEAVETFRQWIPQPGAMGHAIVQGAHTVHVADVTDTEAFRDGAVTVRKMVETTGIRTGLWIGLRRDDALVGLFVLYNTNVRPFTDKQIALLQNFAAQAVIAMENARLLTEQREALEQQTATAEVLQVINASPGNLAPVFDAMLEKATRLCEGAQGILWTYDGETFRPAATFGLAPEFADFLNKLVRPGSGTPIGRVLGGERLVQAIDLAADPSYQAGDPLALAAVEIGATRTLVIVALVKDEALLGAFAISRREVRPFTDKQIALLQNFAAQAVIAMENARLLTEQREALEQQTATAEVLQVINTSPGNLAPVFDAMLEKAMRLCGAAFGLFHTYDDKWLHTVVQRGIPPAYAEYKAQNPVQIRPGSGIARAIEARRTHNVLDLMATEAYAAGEPAVRAMVELGGVRTSLSVPLCKDDAVLGLITVYRQEVKAFSDKQIALLENFAAQAVIAMENARLLDEIRQRQEELRVTFENMGDGVAMFNETQHLVAWNRKFQDILDVPDDIIARRQTFTEYVRYLADRGEYGPETDPEEHVRRLIEQAGQSRTHERTRPDGRVIEIRQNPVPSGGFVLIYADITERKLNEAEIRAARDAAEEASRAIEAAYRELKTAQANLIQAEKMASLGQLTAGIAHEIKNPLNFVNNFAALSVDLLSELKETAAPGFAVLTEKQRAEVEDVSAMLTSNLEKITEHGKRADGIVKAMLEHSRGSSGERRMVDLNALIDEALNLAYHGARAQDQSFNITLERDFAEGIAPIEVNPQDITRVFLNIFANGFYATTRRARDGGDAEFVPTLEVTTRDAGEAVEIRVRDNGTGIPADISDKLFQPFFTTKPTGEGTGLGLSITYDIVTQQHGGNIAVDSKVGEYSEFTIQLPRNP